VLQLRIVFAKDQHFMDKIMYELIDLLHRKPLVFDVPAEEYFDIPLSIGPAVSDGCLPTVDEAGVLEMVQLLIFQTQAAEAEIDLHPNYFIVVSWRSTWLRLLLMFSRLILSGQIRRGEAAAAHLLVLNQIIRPAA